MYIFTPSRCFIKFLWLWSQEHLHPICKRKPGDHDVQWTCSWYYSTAVRENCSDWLVFTSCWSMDYWLKKSVNTYRYLQKPRGSCFFLSVTLIKLFCIDKFPRWEGSKTFLMNTCKWEYHICVLQFFVNILAVWNNFCLLFYV